jgi:hypothetical protein
MEGKTMTMTHILEALIGLGFIAAITWLIITAGAIIYSL